MDSAQAFVAVPGLVCGHDLARAEDCGSALAPRVDLSPEAVYNAVQARGSSGA